MLLNAMNDHSLSWKPQHSTCWVARRKKTVIIQSLKKKSHWDRLQQHKANRNKRKKKSPLYSI